MALRSASPWWGWAGRAPAAPPPVGRGGAAARGSPGALLVLLLAACSAPLDPPGAEPLPTGGSLLLGAAGAPRGTFGDPGAPDFPRGFAELADVGFDLFLPVFLVAESGESTPEGSYFLPPAALEGIDPAVTCAGPRNPWSGAGSIRILLPGYLLAVEQPYSEALDVARYQARLRDFVEVCLEGDPGPLAGIYLHDEPVNNYIADRLDADPAGFVLENVATMAEASRAIVQVPTVIAEAPLPFLLPYYGVSEADRRVVEEEFEQAVRRTVPAASVYGFSLYPVDLTRDLTPLGDYVEEARRLAPEAVPMAVLQGFGFSDMSIDFPPATGRQPTLPEMRAMAFQAVVRGARLLFWYGQSALRKGDPGVWEHVKTVVGELRRTEAALAWPERSADLGNPRVDWTARSDGGGSWIYVVNPTSDAQRVSIPTFGQGPLLDAFTGRRLGTGNAVPLELPGYGVVVACTRCSP